MTMPDIASATIANRQATICSLSCQASRSKPFTPAIETLRGLLLRTEIGHNGWLAGTAATIAATAVTLR
jgi:hypothetical protein